MTGSGKGASRSLRSVVSCHTSEGLTSGFNRIWLHCLGYCRSWCPLLAGIEVLTEAPFEKVALPMVSKASGKLSRPSFGRGEPRHGAWWESRLSHDAFIMKPMTCTPFQYLGLSHRPPTTHPHSVCFEMRNLLPDLEQALLEQGKDTSDHTHPFTIYQR